MPSKNRNENSDEFKAEVRIGILHTIAKSIYASTEIKIREAVANSMDNKASKFIIYLDNSINCLSLFDNGTGISEERFNEIFSYLGYGLYEGKPEYLSYFGLGLMSIIRLGKKAKIFSRTSESDKLFLWTINSEMIFDEKNKKKPIEFLTKCISKTTSDIIERNANSPLKENNINDLLESFPQSFTEIIIEDINDEDLIQLKSINFEEELRKTLPLRADKDEPFLSKIKETQSREKIIKILNNKVYCPTIDVYWGIAEEKALVQLWKYFPDFRRELEFGEANIWTEETEKFAYYFLFSTEDLEDKKKEYEETGETGFWVRNKNFLVKSADYFQKSGGSKKHIMHQPLRKWFFGEIFHKNMNEFLTVSRNEYVWNSETFLQFRNEIIVLVKDLNRKLRKAWEYGSEISKAVIIPFTEIGPETGPFHRVTETLNIMGIPCDGEKAQDILEKLKDIRNRDIENDEDRIDILLSNGMDEIILSDDENSFVVIDPSIDEHSKYTQSIEYETSRIVIKISPAIFSPKEVILLGKTFSTFFIAGKDKSPGISFDVDNFKIFINPFNHDIMKYTISFIDVYIAVELADMLTQTKLEMKHYIYRILGKDFKNAGKYLGPLADDLQRKKRV